MTATAYHPPVKRSVEIAGHKTSVTLEPVFWDLLHKVARDGGVPVNAIVAQIDAERLEAREPTGLASAVRQYLVAALIGENGPDGPSSHV